MTTDNTISPKETTQNKLHNEGILISISDIELTSTEKQCFNYACNLVHKELEHRLLLDKCVHAGVMFVNSDNINISYAIPANSMGMVIRLIVYPVRRWREHNFPKRMIIVSILEELCHCLFGIHDEYDVKIKVFNLLQKETEFEHTTLEELFSGFTIPRPE